MYLNIGSDALIRISEITGIFDLDTATEAAVTKRFLKEKEKKGLVTQAGYELPKSFVLTRDGRVYLSQFSASALKNRAGDYRFG